MMMMRLLRIRRFGLDGPMRVDRGSVSSLSLRFSSLPLSRSCVIIPTISPSPSRLLAGLYACVRFGRMRDHGMHLITKRSFNYVVPLV